MNEPIRLWQRQEAEATIRARDHAIDPNETVLLSAALYGIQTTSDLEAEISYWDHAYDALEVAKTTTDQEEVYERATSGYYA